LPNPLLVAARSSKYPVDLVAAGHFDAAMSMLHSHIAVSNFAPLKPIFLQIYSASRSFLPASPGAPHLSPLISSSSDKFTFVRPFSLHSLLALLQSAYKATTAGKFADAIVIFRNILLSIPFLVVSKKSQLEEAHQLISICREYILGLSIEKHRRDSAPSSTRLLELAAYFTHCSLQPVHEQLALQSAMSIAYKLKCYKSAASFANRLLNLGPSSRIATQANQILVISDRNPNDALDDFAYDPYNPFDICASSYVPIYKGHSKLVCHYCAASYSTDLDPKSLGTCTVCLISKIGDPNSTLASGSIDQGTSSSRFLIFDHKGNVVISHQIEYSNAYPHPGWVQNDPKEILLSVLNSVESCIEKFVKMGHSVSDIVAVGITNQRETTVAWDSETGECLTDAIIWSDTRTRDVVQRLTKKDVNTEIPKICGLPLATYFSAVKMVWMLENVDAVKKANQKGSIDQGTSSSRFLIFDHKGNVVISHQIEYSNAYPHPGWVQNDPKEILLSVLNSVESCIEKFVKMGHSVSDIVAVGITNQRETTVAWDSETGECLTDAIIWSDTRTRDVVQRLTKKDVNTEIPKICGLPLATYFSAVKMVWMLENVDAVKKANQKGTLRFGTIDSWIIYKLTGKHITDVTNASRTMLMDLKTLQWSDKSCEFFGINKSCLAEIKSSSEVYGQITYGALKGVSIAGDLGDQQAATVGQLCFSPGEAKNTYGTGCFMLFNTGETPIFSKNGLLTTVAYQLGPNEKPVYALEGSIAVAGSAIQWLRDKVGLISSSSQVNNLAATVKDNGGVYFVTAFSGLFAPYWRDDARGIITGLTQYATSGHIARATLESVCYQTKDILDAMNADSGTDLKKLRVDGGLTNSDLAMQIQADILGIEVIRPEMRETTAFGAAIAAGLAVGFWKNKTEIMGQNVTTVFKSKIGSDKREKMLVGWKHAVQKSFGSV
ncbi:Glycerol kinase, partial [Zancudomyces culisetae]